MICCMVSIHPTPWNCADC